MKNHLILTSTFILFFCQFQSLNSLASQPETKSSYWEGVSEGAHGESGELILGYDAKSALYTGYYFTSYTTGHGTNYCQFFISGNNAKRSTSFPVKLRDAHKYHIEAERHQPAIEAKVDLKKETLSITFQKVPPSCRWLYEGLPQYFVPQSFRNSDQLKFVHSASGDWLQVRTIQSSRSYFYSLKNIKKSKSKSYLIQGDMIYVYGEDQDWVLAEYHSESAKKVTGWIKKVDLIPLD